MSKGRILLLVAALAAVIVPFLTWQETWFGRQLDTGTLDAYLDDEARPRHIQHALSQIAEHIQQGDPEAAHWYPRIIELSRHPIDEIRATTAWTMGQDNTSQAFQQALLPMVNDSSVMVRRNAALALVRFQNPSGRGELLQMLRPYAVRAPVAGSLEMSVSPGLDVGTGTLLARIDETEVRSPYAAAVEDVFLPDGATVTEGDQIASLAPGPDQAWEALRALYLIGRPEDLDAVEPFRQGIWEMPDKVQQQAELTAQALRNR